ncbi:CinA family protein [Microbacterium lacticum]
MTDVTALSDIARRRRLRVAVAESLTSGALASAVGAGEGASTWFCGGVVAYLPEVKERVLGFPADATRRLPNAPSSSRAGLVSSSTRI